MLNAKTARWRKLDNAAKIFPATSGKKDTRVFRFSCDLKEEIDGDLLQRALDKTMEVYPLFRSVLRKGFFWFYLEKSGLQPIVSEESKAPCSSLYVRDKKTLLFEVTYYKNRINFEVYHAMTDGTGATQFLKELVKNYLLLSHPDKLSDPGPLSEEDLTSQDKEDDSFYKYYMKTGRKREKEKSDKAYQLHGPKTEVENMMIVEGKVSASALLAKAREYGVSITVFLTAVFLCAIHREMSPRQEKKPVILMVPVNLRKYFPSRSMLNFFSWIDPGFQFETGKTTFEDVIAHVRDYFKAELCKERLADRMNALTGLEFNPVLRAAPLVVKNLGLQAGAKLTEKNTTAIYSNMGVVTMPEDFRKYIKYFHVFTSTPKTELCMCSFEDELVMSFTSRYENVNVERNFFEILKENGLKVEMIENDFPERDRHVFAGTRIFQWFTFICIAAAVIMGVVNAIALPGILWSLPGACAVLCLWIVFAIGFYKRRNLLKNAMWQLFFVMACCIGWDMGTGWKGWSVDYVLPGSIILTQLFMLIIASIRHLESKDYMIYYVMAAGTGLVPAVLYAAGAVGESWPSVICAGISVLFLTALLIFKWKELKSELSKKLHL